MNKTSLLLLFIFCTIFACKKKGIEEPSLPSFKSISVSPFNEVNLTYEGELLFTGNDGYFKLNKNNEVIDRHNYFSVTPMLYNYCNNRNLSEPWFISGIKADTNWSLKFSNINTNKEVVYSLQHLGIGNNYFNYSGIMPTSGPWWGSIALFCGAYAKDSSALITLNPNDIGPSPSIDTVNHFFVTKMKMPYYYQNGGFLRCKVDYEGPILFCNENHYAYSYFFNGALTDSLQFKSIFSLDFNHYFISTHDNKIYEHPYAMAGSNGKFSLVKEGVDVYDMTQIGNTADYLMTNQSGLFLCDNQFNIKKKVSLNGYPYAQNKFDNMRVLYANDKIYIYWDDPLTTNPYYVTSIFVADKSILDL